MIRICVSKQPASGVRATTAWCAACAASAGASGKPPKRRQPPRGFRQPARGDDAARTARSRSRSGQSSRPRRAPRRPRSGFACVTRFKPAGHDEVRDQDVAHAAAAPGNRTPRLRRGRGRKDRAEPSPTAGGPAIDRGPVSTASNAASTSSVEICRHGRDGLRANRNMRCTVALGDQRSVPLKVLARRSTSSVVTSVLAAAGDLVDR